MTKRLVESGAFREAPLVVVDVGARGGIESYWDVFGSDIRVVGFEVDPEECKRLNQSPDARVRYLPHALARNAGQRTLYLANHAPSSSFHKASKVFHARHLDGRNLDIVGEVTVETTTLAAALAANGIPTPDFIKIDVEGAELEILEGASDIMQAPEMLGLITEVRFTSALSNCPLFWQIEKYMRECDFELYDLDVYRHSKRALPYPYLYDFRDAMGKPVAGPSIQGQALWGDALYMRDYLRETTTPKPSRRSLIALACLFEMFGLNDCAAEIVLTYPAEFRDIVAVEILLDLLVPEVKARQFSYKDYIGRDLVADRLLRPTEGKRFPEPMIANYDGAFVPSWKKRRFF